MQQSIDKTYIRELYALAFFDLLYQARTSHCAHFANNHIETCQLLSIKTGRCPEDCRYCSQSAHYKTAIVDESLLPVEQVIKKAKLAKSKGVVRFCMAGAWKGLPKKSFEQVVLMVKAVNDLGLETCLSAGALTDDQAATLKSTGLDYYNHNLDTSPEYYPKVVSTRTYQDRLDTVARVANVGIKVCCGGILNMGESREDRIGLLEQLANLNPQPQTVPINAYMAVEGTPLCSHNAFEPFEFIRTLAVARLLLPKAVLRLSAGRETMSETMQALCYFAGANSIFVGDKLLTQSNPTYTKDMDLFSTLNLQVVEDSSRLRKKAVKENIDTT